MTIQNGKPEPKTPEEIEFEDFAQIKNGISQDCWNSVFSTRLDLNEKEMWPEIVPVLTYQEYMRNSKLPHVAEKILNYRHNDKNKIAQFDLVVEEINELIGDGMKSGEQGDQQAVAINLEIDKIREVIYGKK